LDPSIIASFVESDDERADFGGCKLYARVSHPA